MKKLVSLSVLLLTACAAPGPSQYLLGIEQYQGASEGKLINDLGPPDKTYEVDGIKYLTYTKATQQIYNSGPSYGYGIEPRSGVLFNQGFGDTATVQTYRCDVFFAIKNKQVTKVGHRGNAC